MAAPNGFDLDHDSAREFILGVSGSHIEVWENTGPDTFQLAHAIDIPGQGFAYYRPYDVGDADNDGLSDLTVFGRTGNEFCTRLYESTATNNYPTEIVWELPDGWMPVGAKIEDTDNDGFKEIVIAGQSFNYENRIAIYENTGDNSYAQTLYVQIPEMHTPQSMEVAHDLDGDGRDEILFGGLTTDNSGSAKVYAFEATSDNTYQQTWSAELTYTDGESVNPSFIRYAGDLDGDGKKEFLVGGGKTGFPYFTVLYVFEAQSDDDFEIVATFSLPQDLEYWKGADVGDVDADGRKEVLLGAGLLVAVYQNTGNDSWEAVWSDAATIRGSVGAGDHDGDGAQEFLFQQGATSVIEGNIVDSDGDGFGDLIDNCPTVVNFTQTDADGDDVGDACDNCIYGPNPEQGPAIFGQEILALNTETFSWPNPAEIDYVRGDLALVDMYIVDVFETLPLGTSLGDPLPPGSSEGFYYLVKPDCAVGSWQTTLGAEPDRDEDLP